jgi:hypothetical protein
VADINIKVSSQDTSAPGLDHAADGIERIGDEAKKATPKLTGLDGAERAAGRGADQMGDQFDDAKRDASQLMARIAELSASTKALALDFGSGARSGDELTKTFNKQFKELNQLRRMAKAAGLGDDPSVRRLLPVEVFKRGGEEGAGTFAQAFEGGLIKALKTPQGMGVAGALATALAASLGGAALAAAGGGAAAAAVAAAYARDSAAIKSAVDRQTGDFLAKWRAAGEQALDPTLDAIDEIGDAINGINFQSIVGSGSKYLVDLAHAAATAITQIGIGTDDFLKDAGPAVEILGKHIGEFGRVFKETLDLIGGGADGGARALDDLFKIIEAGILTIGAFIRAAEETYDALSTAGDGVQEFMVEWHPFAKAMNDWENSGNGRSIAKTLGDMGHGARHSSADFEELSSQMYNTADAAKELNDRFNDLFGQMLSQDEANLKVKQGMADLNQELRDGKKTLDENTQAGRDNVEAIFEQLDVLNRKREADIAAGNGTLEATKTANAAYAGEVESIRRLLLHLGYTQAEVDALISKYAQIPHEINTTINTFHNDYYARQALQGNAFDPGSRLDRRGVGDRRTGGIIGAAAVGGIHSGMTKVGEEGWEYARLPTGTMVYPHSNSTQMEAMSGGGGGVQVSVALESSGAGDALVEIINTLITTQRLRLKVLSNGRVTVGA